MVFANEEKDVREILNDYKQYDDPIKAFRENQRILKVILLCHFIAIDVKNQ